MKPIVLVTADRRTPPESPPGERIRPARAEVWIGEAYVNAVRAAGGVPVLVPPGADVAALLARADAVVLTGGHFDIDPSHYGQAPLGRLDRVEEARTSVELALARLAMSQGLPLLGICGGMQAMAVAAGGTLVQDLAKPPHPSAHGIDHEQLGDPALASHPVAINPLGQRWLDAEERVNSTHHQAVASPGADLLTIGLAPCGTIEAIASATHRFAVGVQWHPELLGDGRLYRALVRATARAPTSPRGRDRA